MNLTRSIATSVALISAISISAISISAFGLTSTAGAQTSVALVDIGKIFKAHPAFGQQLEVLRREAEQFKAQTEQLKQSLLQEASAINKQYLPSSPEFKAGETQLAQKSAATEVKQRNRMRDLMKQEAKLHFDTYAEVKQVIADYCSRQGIRLVIRFNSQKLDPTVPASIMQAVNNVVVFHSYQKDITNDIVTQIIQSNASASRPQDLNRR